MNEESSNAERDSAFARLGRSLGSTRRGQLVAAVAVATLFCGLAYYAWRHPDLSGIALSIGLFVYGLDKAWRLLPISAATRARWSRERQLAEEHPAGHYRIFFWTGVLMLVSDFSRNGFGAPFDFARLIFPGIAIVVGSVSYLVWWRFLRNEQTPNL